MKKTVYFRLEYYKDTDDLSYKYRNKLFINFLRKIKKLKYVFGNIKRIESDIKSANVYINESYLTDLINSKKNELDDLYFKELYSREEYYRLNYEACENLKREETVIK